MNGPLRFKDDPNFTQQTGIDLSAEAEAVGNYDLSGVREAVIRDIAGGGAASAAAAFQLKALGGLFAVLIGGAGLWWMAQADVTQSPETEAAVAFAEAPAPRIRQMSAEKVALALASGESIDEVEAVEAVVETEPVAEPTVSPAQPDAVVEVPEPSEEPVAPAPDAEEVDDESVDAVADAAEVRPTPKTSIMFERPISDEKPPSDLDARNNHFATIERLVAAEQYGEAYRVAGVFLKRFPEPDRAFADDVLETMLVCSFQLSDWDFAEDLAEVLIKNPKFLHRRAEFARMRAESLVMLNRCEEAVEAAAEADRQVATAIKQQCRKAERAP